MAEGFLGNLAGGLGSVVGGFLGMKGDQASAEATLIANRENNAFQASQADINRQWNLDISNTAHQREVADMKAAGINPMVSGMGGSGAGGGSSPMPSTSPAPDMTGAAGLRGAASIANSAKDIISWVTDMKQKDASIGATNAAADASKASASSAKATAIKTLTEVPLNKLKLQQGTLETPAVAAEAAKRKATADFDSDPKTVMFDGLTSRALQLLQGASSAVVMGRQIQDARLKNQGNVRANEQHLNYMGVKGSKLP